MSLKIVSLTNCNQQVVNDIIPAFKLFYSSNFSLLMAHTMSPYSSHLCHTICMLPLSQVESGYEKVIFCLLFRAIFIYIKVDVSYWKDSGISDCGVATCCQQISGCYKPVLTFLFLVLYCQTSAGPCSLPFQGSFLHRHASVADSTYISIVTTTLLDSLT